MRMNVFHRLRLASKAAIGVFSETSKDQAHGLLAGLWPSGSGEVPDRGTLNYLKAYSTMPWLRALAGRTSEGVASVQWKLFVVRNKDRRVRRIKSLQSAHQPHRSKILTRIKQQGIVEEIDTHPLLDLLNGGNSFLSGHAVNRVTQIHLDLIGDAFWIKERRNVKPPFNLPVAIWPLSPHWVAETPTPSRRTFRVSIKGWQGEIPDTEIVWFANPDPENPYGRGTGLAQALADELETGEFRAKFTKSTFLNRAKPDLIVSPKGDAILTPENTDRLERKWLDHSQGFWRAMKPMFLPKAVDVMEMKHDFKKLQMTELGDQVRDTCIQVWGFPPEILGLIESSNKATITAADFHFAKWVLTPRLELLRSTLQERLVPEFDDRLILDYESPIEEDLEFKREIYNQAPWAFQIDEHRVLAGDLPLENDEGKQRLQPSTLLGTGGQSANLQNLSSDELVQWRALMEKAQ